MRLCNQLLTNRADLATQPVPRLDYSSTTSPTPISRSTKPSTSPPCRSIPTQPPRLQSQGKWLRSLRSTPWARINSSSLYATPAPNRDSLHPSASTTMQTSLTSHPPVESRISNLQRTTQRTAASSQAKVCSKSASQQQNTVHYWTTTLIHSLEGSDCIAAEHRRLRC